MMAVVVGYRVWPQGVPLLSTLSSFRTIYTNAIYTSRPRERKRFSPFLDEIGGPRCIQTSLLCNKAIYFTPFIFLAVIITSPRIFYFLSCFPFFFALIFFFYFTPFLPSFFFWLKPFLKKNVIYWFFSKGVYNMYVYTCWVCGQNMNPCRNKHLKWEKRLRSAVVVIKHFFKDIIADVAYYVGRFSESSWEQNVFRPMIHSNDIDLSKVQLNEVEYPILIYKLLNWENSLNFFNYILFQSCLPTPPFYAFKESFSWFKLYNIHTALGRFGLCFHYSLPTFVGVSFFCLKSSTWFSWSNERK